MNAKLVGCSTSQSINTSSVSITLSTSNWDFAVLKKIAVEAGSSYGFPLKETFLIPKTVSSASIGMIFNINGSLIETISSWTVAATKLSCTNSYCGNYMAYYVELYKYN